MLDEGRYASVSENGESGADRERQYLGRILLLALLPPNLMEAELNWTQAPDVSLPTSSDSMPLIWTGIAQAS